MTEKIKALFDRVCLLLKKDENIKIINESQQKFKVNYRPYRCGPSWRVVFKFPVVDSWLSAEGGYLTRWDKCVIIKEAIKSLPELATYSELIKCKSLKEMERVMN